MAAKTEDRVLAVLDKVLDKLNGLEDRLQQKADVKLVEGLEQKMESVITQVGHYRKTLPPDVFTFGSMPYAHITAEYNCY